MNSDLKRARNKRKRAKLREKRRGGTMRRYFFQGMIIPQVGKTITPSLSTVYRWKKFYGENLILREFFSGWIYSTTHDVNSCCVEWLNYLVKTCKTQYIDTQYILSIWCKMEVNGVHRKELLWQGLTEDLDVAVLVAAVCSFASRLSRN